MRMYYFIVNPGARTGRGKGLWDELQAKLDKAKLEYQVFFTGGAGDATRIAEEICDKHHEMKRIVIVGGDGTANEAINGLKNYNKLILGYIPTGSSNDLARGLGISIDPETALEHAIHPREFKRVDHGVLEFGNGDKPRRFAVSSGIGYDAEVCYEALVSNLKKLLNKFHLGKLIYFILGLKLVFTNKPSPATLIVDGKRTIKTKRLVFVANMNTPLEGGGLPMAPEADPTDGKLACCFAHDISRLKHLMLMPTIFKGNHVKANGVDIINCHSLEVITEKPMALHTDGEFAGRHDHVKFSCMPEKVRMIV